MIDFNKEQYEWQKSMDILMVNVNLSNIHISNIGNIEFDFLNSYDGSFYKKLICSHVWKIITNLNQEKGEEFPIFICDVKTYRLVNNEIREAFSFYKYGFNIPQSKEYWLVSMDSGDISIQLICEAVILQ